MCVFFLLGSSPAMVSGFHSFLAWLLLGLCESGEQEEDDYYCDKPGAHQDPAITNTLIKINSIGAMPTQGISFHSDHQKCLKAYLFKEEILFICTSAYTLHSLSTTSSLPLYDLFHLSIHSLSDCPSFPIPSNFFPFFFLITVVFPVKPKQHDTCCYN